ncbi:small multi-drug export protein [Methanonatronarchaeum sp. AMET-Sl]|uniref:small multi-drug export protein n=1 Tax=Methanonatronarchaeum sp. AMET-Sl TaxID=3037654 RepID=UPI00244E033F|nr:small multi-drug export protein [Methanonatronarchaeum sp. AMET-Sl]WGI16786.1 small multi-drug export protein [Methanonatronarchaeum sp. AMET-Sl]
MISKAIDVYRDFKKTFISCDRKETGFTLFKFFFPFFIGGLYLTIIYLFFDYETLYPLVAAHLFPPFGKESIIPAGIAFGVSPLAMAGLMAALEVIVGTFMIWNYDLLKGVPFLGRYVGKVEGKGREKLSRIGWANRFAFAAIALLVMVPFQGSGTITASITGRIIGMKVLDVWMAIVVGAISSNLLIAFFADTFIGILRDNLVLGVIILLFLGIVLWIVRDKNRNKNNG